MKRHSVRRFLVTTLAVAIARVVCLAAGRDPRKPLAAGLVLLACAACGPLDSWNAPKVGYIDPNTGCYRFEHAVRGPDAYDVAHGRPYHCEASAPDLDNIDIDMVDQ